MFGLALIAACLGNPPATPTSVTIGPTVAPTQTTVETTLPNTTTTEQVPRILAGGSARDDVREPDEVILLPWGTGVGEVASDGPVGPLNIDVAADGLIVLNDIGNSRVQTFDGEAWMVLVEYGQESEFVPWGVAALDNGLIAVQGLPRGSGGVEAQTALLYDRDGNLIDQGRVPTLSNFYWGGGADAWSAVGYGVPYLWVKLTNEGRIVSWTDEELDELNRAVDRQMRNAPADEPPWPLDELVALGYTQERSDSGITLRFAGGSGWTPSDPQLPLEVHVTRSSGTQVWVVDNTGSPCCWEVDGTRLISVSYDDPYLVIIDAGVDGTWEEWRINRDQVYDTNVWDFVRLENGRLYVLQSTEETARIDVFHLTDG